MAAFMCESREDPIREQHYVRTLLSRRVDGIIVAGRRTDDRAPLAQHLPIPVVYASPRRRIRPTARSSATRRRARRARSSTCSRPAGGGSRT
jgi:LacI family transcriptional regulator